MLASGVGLVALVVVDLRESVRVQEERARGLARAQAERGARELAAALARADVLERVPSERRFRMEAGRLLIPAQIGWLEPPADFDPARGMDAIAREKLARAVRSESRAEWALLGEDPTLSRAARSWVACRRAWLENQHGNSPEAERLLTELDPGAPPEVAASALLLDGVREIFRTPEMPRPDLGWARAALARFPDARGDAVLAELYSVGDVESLRRSVASARAARAVLRRVRPHERLLAAATSLERRALDGELLLYFPEPREGALIDLGTLDSIATALVEEGALGLGGTLAPDDGALDLPRVVAGFACVRPAEVQSAGLASGAGGLALLAVALAALCGGGAFLALRGARREAEAARVRSEFVTGVTHELKTPLAGIRLTADLLLDGHVRDEAGRRVHLERLAGEALRLGVLIENVLDLGRLERGERGHRPERADLVELTAETLALFAPLAAQSGVELAFARPGIALHANVDRDALRQALLNVLDNARKYGGGERVEVGLARAGAELVLSVRDFGPGVPAEERALVFERFRRGARHQDGSVPGVGLGLYLARELLRRHGGELACVAPPDGGPGARFELRLPAEAEGARA